MPLVKGIPRVVHFVYGLATDPDEREFSFTQYLAVVSAVHHIRPTSVVFHHHHEPSGHWWNASRPYLSLRRIDLPTSIYGHPLEHSAHRADVVRLKALLSEGGIYLDMDVVVLKSFDALLGEAVAVMGQEGVGGAHGLCNAVILSPRGARFVERWLNAYKTFDPSHWADHSVKLPFELARLHPEEVQVQPHDAFFWPMWDDLALRRLLLYDDYPFARNFAAHLWSQASREYVLSVWSPAFIFGVPSALNCRIRGLLPVPAGWKSSASCSQSGGGEPGAPVARWALSGLAGAVEGRVPAWCHVRDESGGGHGGFVFVQGCGSSDHSPPQTPFAPAAGSGPPHLSVQAGAEVFLSLALRLESVTIAWLGRVPPPETPQPNRSAPITWWSLSFGRHGQLIAGASDAGDGSWIPGVRTLGLRRSPLPCGGLVGNAVDIADGLWHAYVVQVTGGLLWPSMSLHVDGDRVASAPWRLPAAPAMGMWLGTTEPTIAGRGRPSVRRGPSDAGMAHLEVFSPSLGDDGLASLPTGASVVASVRRSPRRRPEPGRASFSTAPCAVAGWWLNASWAVVVAAAATAVVACARLHRRRWGRRRPIKSSGPHLGGDGGAHGGGECAIHVD